MSITFAPLPKISDLVISLFKKKVCDDVLSRIWSKDGGKSFWFSRSTWSLTSFVNSRKKLQERKPIIWIPDYFCNSVLGPIRKTGAKIVFYPIDSNLNPNKKFCENLACNQPPDIFVLVHYFGKPAFAPWLKSFCEGYQCWLIEDAAHVFLPITGIGELGDIVIYSPHKHLPIPDGAVQIVLPSGPSKLAKNEEFMNIHGRTCYALYNMSGFSLKPTILWFFKRTLQCLGVGKSPKKIPFQNDIVPEANFLPHPRMSFLANRLLDSQLKILQEVVEKRKTLHQTWVRLIPWSRPGKISITPIFSEKNGIVYYMSGFVSESALEAEKLYQLLQSCKLPVTTWPDLPPEVFEDPDVYKTAINLREKSFFLPLHQTISDSSIKTCGKRLLQTISENWQVSLIDRGDWNSHWMNCKMANILQSWEYGSAKEKTEGWKPKRFLIKNQEGKVVGLIQVLFRGLPYLGGMARINRGPLIVGEWPQFTEITLKLVLLYLIVCEAKSQRWWFTILAPELSFSDESFFGLDVLGFRQLNKLSWESGRLCLKLDEQLLLMSLKGKFRTSIRKGHKLGVNISKTSAKGDNLEILINQYRKLKKKQIFTGLKESLIREIVTQPESASWRFNLFFAFGTDSSFLGLLVSVLTGDTSTYLIGITTDEGRKMQVNSVMLWEAILQAKNDGCEWFDIGGISKNTPKGIVNFKRGINAEPYKLVGEYITLFNVK